MKINEKIKIFNAYSFQQKVDFIVHFYEAMKLKTQNLEYLSKFVLMVKKVEWYTENEENSQNLISLYFRILDAEQQTQEWNIKKRKDSVTALQNKSEDFDADDYLTEQLARIQ